LDSQKRAFNKLGWPYIGISLHNNNLRVCVCCEAIVNGETIVMYTWIIQTMCKMEPRWCCSNLKIIFGDGFITPRLLRNLGIESSCVLHGDFFHLLNEVWPNKDNFGAAAYATIKKYLRVMLRSKTIEEWNRAYNKARLLLIHLPLQLELLDKIHNNPRYYSGYYIRTLPCNLQRKGDVPAEQNHSSNVSHLGDGATWSLMQQVKSGLQRQQQHHISNLTLETNHWFDAFHCQTESSSGCVETMLAKQSLATWPFVHIWKVSCNAVLNFQSETINDSHYVWPIAEVRTLENTVVFAKNERCICQSRLDYDGQCNHELCVEFKFNVHHFNSRWYSTKVYNQIHPRNIPTLPVEMIDMLSSQTRERIMEMETMESSIEFGLPVSHGTAVTEKITYAEMLDAAKALISTVQNNQSQMKSVLESITDWTNELRKDKDISISFQSQSIPSQENNLGALSNSQPRASITALPHWKCMNKRLKPGHEYHGSQNIARTPALKMICEDAHFASKYKPPNKKKVTKVSKTKTCELCGGKKHFQYNCPYLCEDGLDGTGIACQSKCKSSRDKICNELNRINNFVKTRPDGDCRVILPSMPKTVRGLQIHNKFYILFDPNNLNKDITNVCVECTIIDQGGMKNPTYTKVLFKPVHVGRFVSRSQSNLVCSWMTS